MERQCLRCWMTARPCIHRLTNPLPCLLTTLILTRMTPSESSGIHTQLSRSRAQLLCRMQLSHTELCPRSFTHKFSRTHAQFRHAHISLTHNLPPALSHTHTLCHTRGAGLGLVTWLSMHNSFRHKPFPARLFHSQLCHTHHLLCLSCLSRPRFHTCLELWEEMGMWGYPVV